MKFNIVGIAVERMRLSNSLLSDDDENLVLGNAETNLDQEEILPSMSNSNEFAAVMSVLIGSGSIMLESFSLSDILISSERGLRALDVLLLRDGGGSSGGHGHESETAVAEDDLVRNNCGGASSRLSTP